MGHINRDEFERRYNLYAFQLEEAVDRRDLDRLERAARAALALADEIEDSRRRAWRALLAGEAKTREDLVELAYEMADEMVNDLVVATWNAEHGVGSADP